MPNPMQAAVDLLVRHAPPKIYLDRTDTLHVRNDCAPGRRRARRLSAAALGARLMTSPLWICNEDDGCEFAPETAWGSTVGWVIFYLYYLGEFANDPADALMHRLEIAPQWLTVDPHRDRQLTCCMAGDVCRDPADWSGTFERLMGQHFHERMTALAAAHGTPTTWVALPTSHLVPSPRTRHATRPLAPLGTFHPWATAAGGRDSAGIVILHLPPALADLALAHGGLRLDPAHVSATAWPAARAILTCALAEPGTVPADFTTSADERAVLARLPAILEVAHAATH